MNSYKLMTWAGIKTKIYTVPLLMSTLQVSMDISSLSQLLHGAWRTEKLTVSNSFCYCLRTMARSTQQARGKSVTLAILKAIQVEIALTSLETG